VVIVRCVRLIPLSGFILFLLTSLQSVEVAIPTAIDLTKLTSIVHEITDVSISIAGDVNGQMIISGQFSRTKETGLWELYIQSLANHDITVVLANDLGAGILSYRVVPLRDAAKATVTIDAVALTKMTYPPGYVSVTVPLRFLGLDAATAVVAPVAGASGAVRPLGAGQPVLVINGVRPAVQAAIRLLTTLDVADSQPVVRSIIPTHASPLRAGAP
jgi:hypothetical protein